MNVTDPLEDHRRNLFSFYTACKIYENATSQSDEAKGNFPNAGLEDHDPNFLSFLNFRVQSNQENSQFCDRNNGIPQTNDFMNRFDCNEEIESEEDVYDNERSGGNNEDGVAKVNSEMELFQHKSSDENENDTSINDSINFNDVEAYENDDLEALLFQEKTNEKETENTLTNPKDDSQPDEENLDVEKSVSNEIKEVLRRYYCEHCNKNFRTKKRIRHHVQTCCRSNEILTALIPKKRTWKRSTKDDKTCKLCGHVARKPCELKLHMTSKHSDIRPFSCNQCGIGFTSKSKLNRHIKNQVHAKGKFYCELCKIYFSVEGNYERHKFEHDLPLTVVKPFVCHICDKRFHRIDILRKHSLSHMRKDNVPLNLSTDNH